MTEELFFDDVIVGDKGHTPSRVVTKEMILAYADLTGDLTPIHVDEEYARNAHFGTIVAHGLLGLALADGLKTQADLQFPPGMSLGWTWDFLLPIKVDDSVHVEFTVASMRPTRKSGWGIVFLASELINQHGQVVQRGEHKLMIRRRQKVAGA